jgi:hypothetical protein
VLLGRVERAVGRLEHRPSIDAARAKREADADRNRDRHQHALLPHASKRFDSRPHLFGDRENAFQRRVGQNGDELFAAEAGHQVQGAIGAPAQLGGDQPQAVVSRRMSERVVVLLEKVHVDEEQPQARIQPVRVVEGQLEMFFVRAAILERRQ